MGASARPGADLTYGELRVLVSVAHGRTSGEIAIRHGVAEHTVHTVLYRIFRKLGARSRAHAVTIGFVRGYLKLPSDTDAVKAAVAEAVLLS